MDHQAIVKQIIASSNFLSLATTDGESPWANAVFFAADKDYNLYFVSLDDTVHVQNILKNPNVSVVIFDSHHIPGSEALNGVQIKGTCHEVSKEELPEAIEVTYTKRFPNRDDWEKYNINVEAFSKTEKGSVHVYKIVPEHFYILDKELKKKLGKDVRVEMKLHN
jgi:uncharacterized protein YhbP (UPF0306 family)